MDHVYLTHVAATLKQLLAQRGWNQSELARRAGIGADSISRYLNGQYSPSARHLAKIAAAFEVNPAEIYNAMEEADQYVAELRLLRDDPAHALLKINQLLPTEVALQILALANKGRTVSN